MLHWAALSSSQSTHVDKTILTTDDPEIAELGDGIREIDEVRIRPSALAKDDVGLTDVIVDIVEFLSVRNENYGVVVLLQPTSPLRTGRHIDEAFSVIEQQKGIGAVSVCRTEHPREWMGNISDDLRLDGFFMQTQLNQQSQLFEASYQVNGAIYIVPTASLIEARRLFLPKGMVAYVMSRSESVDVDYQFDLDLAEWLMGRREMNGR